MFKSYFKTALRNLLKYKIYSIINIFSMAVGMGAFILIVLYIQYEEDRINSIRILDQFTASIGVLLACWQAGKNEVAILGFFSKFQKLCNLS